MSQVPPTPYRGRHGVRAQEPAEPEERRVRRLAMFAGALTLLGLAVLVPRQVAPAGTDPSAAGSSSAPDSTLRWQFDTGG